MTNRERNVEIFENTQLHYRTDNYLKRAIKQSQQNIKIVPADTKPMIRVRPRVQTRIETTMEDTLTAATRLYNIYTGQNIAILNFASSTKPGGGVKNGSTAQEEDLCRYTTLYPCLTTPYMWDNFYQPNREKYIFTASHAMVWIPRVIIFKHSDDPMVLLPPEQRVPINVISCAAPNLRPNKQTGVKPSIKDVELLNLHIERARRILTLANNQGVNVLVLGAFGCGVFENDPNLVAEAYSMALERFHGDFLHICFAIKAKHEKDRNYKAFSRFFKDKVGF